MASVYLIYGYDDRRWRTQIELWHRWRWLGVDTVIGYEPDAHRPGGPRYRADLVPSALEAADKALVILPECPRGADLIGGQVDFARRCARAQLLFVDPRPQLSMVQQQEQTTLSGPRHADLVGDSEVLCFDVATLRRALR